MRLATFIPRCDVQGGVRFGALTDAGDAIADLAMSASTRDGEAHPQLADALTFLDGGAAALVDAQAALTHAAEQQPPGVTHRVCDVRLMAPVPRPRSIRDCMLFEEHLRQAQRAALRNRLGGRLAGLDDWVQRRRGKGVIPIPDVFYEQPIYYKSNPFTVVGPGAEVRWPSYSERLDYELEFGIFIGRGGVNIPATQAAEHIAGFTIFNDFSARDAQMREMGGRLGPAKGKDFDTGNAMGPYLVTPDEIPDPYSLTMVARVNGVEWSRGSSAGMQHSFAEVIAHVSRDETLYPGEFIGSGTVGNGCGLELDRWLRPGDTVELEVEGLGVLRNRVVRVAG